MLQQVIAVSLLTVMAATPPAVSQGIKAGSCGDCSNRPAAAPAVKVLVATPYPSPASDSANAVSLGVGIRDKLTRNINGEWQVITRRDMNTSLMTWGYNPDALLGLDQVRVMTGSIGARVMVTTTMSKTPDGRYSTSTRMTGLSDDAGHVVKMTQTAGQSLGDFGSKIADQLTVVFKAYADARVCNDQQTSNKVKAVEAANKALKQVPNYGYAEYCLGLIELQKDTASAAALSHFKNTMVSDPLSLRAEGHIAAIDLIHHDSAAVVTDFQQMLTIAPTDRKLIENAINVFRQFNRPDAAAQVVDQQMQLDPSNPDWPDLKGNMCAYQAATDADQARAKVKFQCAYDAFEKEYQLDPTRGDSAFFPRIVYVAQRSADSAKWIKIWVQKAPTAIDPLKLQAQMFVDAGELDSAVRVARTVMAIDSSETKPVMAVVQKMLAAHHEETAVQFIPDFKKRGDEASRNLYAQILIGAVQTLAQQNPRPDSVLVLLGQGIVDLSPTAPNYLVYGNYFMAIGLADQLPAISTTTRSAKTCEATRAEEALLSKLEPALTVAATSSTAAIASFANDWLPKLAPEKTYIAGMVAEKCK